jgi:uncharacterized protein YndB with AHSA1/START domain
MTASSRRTDPRHELVIRRTFDAPRALVWKAWTDRAHATQWGPKGFTTPEREMDLRPGGAWHAVMISPDGQEYRQHGVVQEVVAPERLVFTFIWDATPDNEMLITVTLAESGGQTEMTFRQTGLETVASRDGHEGGWNEAFDQLGEVVATLTTASHRH